MQESAAARGDLGGLRPEQFHAHLAKSDPFWVRLVSDDRLVDIAARLRKRAGEHEQKGNSR